MVINGNKIEAIIFDFGGVIINIDIQNTFQRLKSLGIGLNEEGLQIIKKNNTFIRFETGELSPSAFRDEMRIISSKKFTDSEFDEIWNSMILDYPIENIRLLENLKSKYRTFLMSNTNQIHLEYFSDLLNKEFGYSSLDLLFEKVYYSHIIHKRKPNEDFFEYILNENSLNPQSTVFIDDFPENIAAAKQLGINTIHLTDGKKLAELALT